MVVTDKIVMEAPGYGCQFSKMRNKDFLRVLVPVEHIVLFKPVLGGPTMVLFHESHHLIILGLPSFVLCHSVEIDDAKIRRNLQICKLSLCLFLFQCFSVSVQKQRCTKSKINSICIYLYINIYI